MHIHVHVHTHAEEQSSLTWLNVAEQYLHKLISVRPALLMPSPQGMEYFMDHRANPLTPLPNGDALTPPHTTNVGKTSAQLTGGAV